MSTRGGDTDQTHEPPGVTRTCYQCGGTDHFKKDRPQLNKGSGDGKIYKCNACDDWVPTEARWASI